MIIVLVIMHFVILLCSLVGSTTMCLVITTSRELRSPADIYLGNLALAFVLSSLFGSLLLDNVLMEWTNGLAMCKTVQYVVQTCFLAAVLTLTAATFERFFNVCKHSSYCESVLKRPALVCFLCWVASCLISVPLLFLAKVEGVRTSREYERICVTTWPPGETWQAYFSLLTCALYILPFAAMFCSQRITLRKLREPQSTKSGGNRVLNQRRQRIMCILIFISALHFALFLPHEILSTLHYFGVKISQLQTAWCVAKILKFISSAISSVICIAKHEVLRRNLKELLGCFYSRTNSRT